MIMSWVPSGCAFRAKDFRVDQCDAAVTVIAPVMPNISCRNSVQVSGYLPGAPGTRSISADLIPCRPRFCRRRALVLPCAKRRGGEECAGAAKVVAVGAVIDQHQFHWLRAASKKSTALGVKSKSVILVRRRSWPRSSRSRHPPPAYDRGRPGARHRRRARAGRERRGTITAAREAKSSSPCYLGQADCLPTSPDCLRDYHASVNLIIPSRRTVETMAKAAHSEFHFLASDTVRAMS